MLDLIHELADLSNALEDEKVPYALCGGLAMAVFGKARATADIDLLIPLEDAEHAQAVARQQGFKLKGGAMKFAKGAIEIRRSTKIDPETGAPLCVDFLLVTQPIEKAWNGRRRVKWKGGMLWVVSRSGLVSLKLLRNSGQDKEDIQALKRRGR